MKVTLILPTMGYDHGYPVFFSNSDFPTGFAYIAAAVKNAGHEVIGVNPNNDTSYTTAYDMVKSKITESLSKCKPGLIGLGGLSTDYNFIKDAIAIIREIDKTIPIVLGGGIINSDPEFIFTQLKTDYCIKGEAEETIISLIRAIDSDDLLLDKIANIGYWTGKIPTPIFTKQDLNYIDINERAFPDYEPFGLSTMLNDYALATRYMYRYIRTNPRPMTIVSARGCPFSCTFCIHGEASDERKYRARNIENIIDEIYYLYQKYQFNILIILDELFVAKKGRLNEFSNAIIEAKGKYGWDFNWIFQTHANSKLNYDTFKLAKMAGCYCFTYGLESASPSVIESMNKKSKIPAVVEAINLADQVGLGFYAAFIFGDIVENESTVQESMEFFNDYCTDLHIYFAAISPYPGSTLFDDCIDKGVITDRLQYYESIDKVIYNMTKIENKLWYPWTYLAIYLSRFFNYAKSTDAISCNLDENMSDNPVTKYTGQMVYDVMAKCPHCNQNIYYKEPLEIDAISDKPKQFSIKSTLWKVIGLKENKYDMLKIIKNGALNFAMTFRHPIYKNLKYLTGNKKLKTSFTTGCTCCNKRILINVNLSNSTTSTFNIIRMIIRNIVRR